jgi:hypothetical protein
MTFFLTDLFNYLFIACAADDQFLEFFTGLPLDTLRTAHPLIFSPLVKLLPQNWTGQ